MSVAKSKGFGNKDILIVLLSSDDISNDEVQDKFTSLLSYCESFEVTKSNNKNLKYTFVFKE